MRPNASTAVVAELGGAQMVRRAAILMRSGMCCKKKEHSGLIDITVIYQHAWSEHNDHRTSMMLCWQADRIHHLSRGLQQCHCQGT